MNQLELDRVKSLDTPDLCYEAGFLGAMQETVKAEEYPELILHRVVRGIVTAQWTENADVMTGAAPNVNPVRPVTINHVMDVLPGLMESDQVPTPEQVAERVVLLQQTCHLIGRPPHSFLIASSWPWLGRLDDKLTGGHADAIAGVRA
jgi:hypothetical protein